MHLPPTVDPDLNLTPLLLSIQDALNCGTQVWVARTTLNREGFFRAWGDATDVLDYAFWLAYLTRSTVEITALGMQTVCVNA